MRSAVGRIYALRNNALDAEGCTVLEAGSAVPLVISPVATAAGALACDVGAHREPLR